uniref:Putative ovule protein n=1 Tax=Solanum chacoense TaxID=4108 RepID=A0A0V0GK98_SOLCH
MENKLGLLRVRIIRGINLAIRDLRSSDPYVVVRMGKQVISPLLFHLFFFFLLLNWNINLSLSSKYPSLAILRAENCVRQTLMIIKSKIL